MRCQQGCGQPAAVYAMGSGSGDWGGYFCRDCARTLRLAVTDVLRKGKPQ